ARLRLGGDGGELSQRRRSTWPGRLRPPDHPPCPARRAGASQWAVTTVVGGRRPPSAGAELPRRGAVPLADERGPHGHGETRRGYSPVPCRSARPGSATDRTHAGALTCTSVSIAARRAPKLWCWMPTAARCGAP